ncbi:MAG TPA: hypothetical protein VLT32_11165 [Candidatus Sulfomarinibacteraceae bacterium]|nr:hypothetical protein [Candidatus Sulfomarinibacteraceae bacterium]
MTRAGARRWLQLAAGFAAVALVIAALHLGVGRAGGPFGRIWSANLASGVNANAFFYTEVGAVGEFIDVARGRYAVPPQPCQAVVTTSSDAPMPR